MIIDINVKNKDIKYPIIVERNSLNKVNNYFNLDRKVLIVTDTGIPNEYINTVKEKCKEPFIFTVKQGEESKNFDNYKNMLEYMVKKTFTRTDCVIAIGGGVVGDLSGFVASSYMRGIDFYNIPTTLLSQVDSSIGGKCAIDFNGVKNNIGAFKNPNGVLIDPNVLKTLDDRQISAGMAEVIKMSITSNKALFNFIEQSKDLNHDLEYIITETLKIKANVVSIDPFENDLRKVLNFGHTIGHAIEALSNGSLLHGECVSIGMTYMVSDEIKDEVKYSLRKYNLPVSITNLNKEEVINLIKLDKKASGNDITIVYVSKIGSFEFKKIKVDELKEYLK
ncbi:MAG: 3-dehydroquinate synthase [Acholeplasmatales bacterium]|nr:3-dehydroquinate synthase [Acholeplasmatales bacterium]